MFQIMGLFRRLVYLIIVVVSIVYNFFFAIVAIYKPARGAVLSERCHGLCVSGFLPQ